MSSRKLVEVISYHPTEGKAIAALSRAAQTIASEGKADRFSVQLHQTNDPVNPYQIRLYERK